MKNHVGSFVLLCANKLENLTEISNFPSKDNSLNLALRERKLKPTNLHKTLLVIKAQSKFYQNFHGFIIPNILMMLHNHRNKTITTTNLQSILLQQVWSEPNCYKDAIERKGSLVSCGKFTWKSYIKCGRP